MATIIIGAAALWGIWRMWTSDQRMWEQAVNETEEAARRDWPEMYESARGREFFDSARRQGPH